MNYPVIPIAVQEASKQRKRQTPKGRRVDPEAGESCTGGRDVGLDLVVVAHEGAHLQVLGDGHAGEGAAAFGHHHQALLDQIPGGPGP